MNTTTILWAFFIAIVFASWPITAKYLGTSLAWTTFTIYLGGFASVSLIAAKRLIIEPVTGKAFMILLVVSLLNGAGVWAYSLKAIDKEVNTSLLMATISLAGIVVAPLINWVVNHETINTRQFIGIGLAMIVVWLMKK